MKNSNNNYTTLEKEKIEPNESGENSVEIVKKQAEAKINELREKIKEDPKSITLRTELHKQYLILQKMQEDI